LNRGKIGVAVVNSVCEDGMWVWTGAKLALRWLTVYLKTECGFEQGQNWCCGG